MPIVGKAKTYLNMLGAIKLKHDYIIESEISPVTFSQKDDVCFNAPLFIDAFISELKLINYCLIQSEALTNITIAERVDGLHQHLLH